MDRDYKNAMTIESSRTANLTLWGGILFSFLFTLLIAWAGQRLEAIQLLPDQGPAWYYWKLPQPTTWTRLSAWGLYLLHQVSMWGLIYYAQNKVKTYTNGLHGVNIAALGVNALFIVIHFIQTHIFYDGLAQDVSIFSSQGSVIVLLVWVLLMENKRRGLFFGKKAPIKDEIIAWARKYHGYFFAWATIYTFWYHPMVSTPGHLVGFFYMFLLLLQGSLFLTRIHLNRYWMVTQELMVAIHGTIVALVQGNNLWPMFFFGFGALFILTQMHGLRWPLWPKLMALALYFGGAVWVYYGRWAALNEIIRIPIIDYLSVVILALLIGGGLALGGWIRQLLNKSQPAISGPGAAD